MKYLILALMSFAMLACSMSKDDSHNTDPAITRQNQYVDATYGPIVGTYMGTLTSGSTVQQVRLIILVTDKEGRNSDGTPTTVRVPSATFTRIDPIGRDFNLTVSYTPETSSLAFTNPTANGGNGDSSPGSAPSKDSTPVRDDDIKTMSGYLTGQRIVGDATSVRSVRLGTIDLIRTTNQTDLPGDDRNERRRRLYETLVGQYCGSIADPYDHARPQIISLKLRIDAASDPSSPSGTRPILSAFYERLEKPPGVLDLAMAVNFESPPAVVISGRGLGNYAVTFTGVLQNGQVKANLSTAKDGPLGEIILKKNDPLCLTKRPNNPILPK